MNGAGRAADGAGVYLPVPGVDADVFHQAVELIQAADPADVQRTVGVDPADHQADVVQVGGDDQVVSLPAQVRDDASLVRHFYRETEALDLPDDVVLNLPELAGGAVDGQELLKLIETIGFIKAAHGILLPAPRSGSCPEEQSKYVKYEIF